MRCALIPSNPTPPNAGCSMGEMRCKRCEKKLLLKSEQDLALCLTCQQILLRPPLIEPTREPQYLIDDLYCLDNYETNPKQPTISSLPYTRLSELPKNDGFNSGSDRQFLSVLSIFVTTILVIIVTVVALIRLHPHLVGFDSLDLLTVLGWVSACWLWWQTIKAKL